MYDEAKMEVDNPGGSQDFHINGTALRRIVTRKCRQLAKNIGGNCFHAFPAVVVAKLKSECHGIVLKFMFWLTTKGPRQEPRNEKKSREKKAFGKIFLLSNSRLKCGKLCSDVLENRKKNRKRSTIYLYTIPRLPYSFHFRCFVKLEEKRSNRKRSTSPA